MPAKDKEKFTPTQDANNNSLTDVQSQKWREYPDINREWPTPHLSDFVEKALKDNVPQEVFVVGIGGLAKDAIEYSKIPGVKVSGIDINEEAVNNALYDTTEENVKFSVGDILDPNIVDTFGKDRFGVVTFIGLATNLIRDKDATVAFSHAHKVLAEGGSIVISDYALGEGEEYWIGRYERDAAALQQAGYGEKKDLFGTIIIRPNGSNAKEVEQITTQDMSAHIREENFQRLARHRSVNTFTKLLKESGFKMKTLKHYEIPNEQSWEKSQNIQLRAIKPHTVTPNN